MARTAPHCIFCDLIQGAAEVSVCYEDSDAIAFMDVQPVNGGHVLVVPRDHYESLCDVPAAVAMHLFEVSMRLAPIIRDVSGCGDMNLVVNSGEAAGQNVFHYHVHLIPRKQRGHARPGSAPGGAGSCQLIGRVTSAGPHASEL